MGRWHFDSYKANPRVEVVGFVDTSIDRAERFARETGGRAYRSHQELLAEANLWTPSASVPCPRPTATLPSTC